MLCTTNASTSGVASGAIPGVLSTIDGDPKAGFPLRDQYVKDSSSLGTYLDGEFYSRYFINRGPRSGFTTYQVGSSSVASQTTSMDYIISNNNSLNIYMFHGGPTSPLVTVP